MEEKEKAPIPRSFKALLVDDQVKDLYVPHKGRIEAGMRGEIEFASSVQEALEILERQAQNGSLPNIVVTDLYVPTVNDSFKLIKTIRTDPRMSSLPICVITVCPEESEKLQLKELGVEQILDKGSVAYDSQKIRWAWEESQEKEPNPRQFRYLWVDDRAPERLEIHEELLKKGLKGEIEFVLSGEKALKILEKKAKEGTLPDLVISDLDMPHMTGLEFVEVVRNHEDERIRVLPICIVSGLVPVSVEEKFEELGIPIFDFRDALLKPERIRQILEESKIIE